MSFFFKNLGRLIKTNDGNVSSDTYGIIFISYVISVKSNYSFRLAVLGPSSLLDDGLAFYLNCDLIILNGWFFFSFSPIFYCWIMIREWRGKNYI